jgi:hypothetical protein
LGNRIQSLVEHHVSRNVRGCATHPDHCLHASGHDTVLPGKGEGKIAMPIQIEGDDDRGHWYSKWANGFRAPEVVRELEEENPTLPEERQYFDGA